ncbi:MAG: bifunctional phosphopantothenoylcysteine decarboxylase/phosphopantothenate--cysteine ligase CoaBC [Gammaproteobacteria bacterium]|nr:bifunctional phosphopantothenoylcysteine decarboxylase/phosphopantothenate--cysteine ligase CoaBC [Gammaproteobacteria bacterium]
MGSLTNKRVVVGVTGSIAAYKSADLVRRLREAGAAVRVVMTRGACSFITPLTLQALSEHPVHTELLDAGTESGMGHIDLARWSDVVLVAPASANFMARLSVGMADDLLSTLCLATSAPLVLGPARGEQACGETGPGRMLEPAALVLALAGVFETGSLSDRRVMVTAGPTREDIDPVRFVSNRSSGRMGYAVARAAAEAGAEVRLVTGPVDLDPPERVSSKSVYSAEQMYQAVMADVDDTDIFIAAAAVADYRGVAQHERKLKKSNGGITLTLERTPDILAAVASQAHPPFTIGFAAETENLLHNARIKLESKALDIVAANLVGGPELGFESEENALELVWRGGGLTLARASKDQLARKLITVIAERYHEKNTTQGP